jgi:hypothetical protein
MAKACRSLLIAAACVLGCGSGKLTQAPHGSSSGGAGGTGQLISSTGGGDGATSQTSGTSASVGGSGSAGAATGSLGNSGSGGTIEGSGSTGEATGSGGSSATTGTHAPGGANVQEQLPGAQAMQGTGHALEVRTTPDSRPVMSSPHFRMQAGAVGTDAP